MFIFCSKNYGLLTGGTFISNPYYNPTIMNFFKGMEDGEKA